MICFANTEPLSKLTLIKRRADLYRHHSLRDLLLSQTKTLHNTSATVLRFFRSKCRKKRVQRTPVVNVGQDAEPTASNVPAAPTGFIGTPLAVFDNSKDSNSLSAVFNFVKCTILSNSL